MKASRIFFLMSTSSDPVWDSLISQYGFDVVNSDATAYPNLKSDSYDDLLRGYTGTAVTNSSTRTSGITGQAIVSSASTDSHTIEYGLSQYSFNSGGSDLPFSVELWVYLTAVGVESQFLISKRAAGTDREWDISLSSPGGFVEFSLYTSGGVTNFLRARSTTALSTSQWYHLICTYDGSKTLAGIKIYLNGSLLSQTSQGSGTYTGMTTYSTSNLTLGNVAKASNSSVSLKGYCNQISIWSRQLSQSDVTKMYNSGTPKRYRSLSSPSYFETKYAILHRNGNYLFATDGGSNLLYSSDNGVTWYTKAWGAQYSGGLPTPSYGVTCANVFSNGDVMFCTAVGAYYSTDGLVNINVSTILDRNGNAYVFHTPVNAARPGAYFYNSSPSQPMTIGGVEGLIWANYSNNDAQVGLGASPCVVWYTINNGQTIKEVYTFGQNTNYRDDGSLGGGPTGNLLGDSGNSKKTRHCHAITQRPGTDTFYGVFGDGEGANNEIRWVRFDYSSGTWTVNHIYENGVASTRWKAGALNFYNDEVYFTADSTGTVAVSDRGVHKTSIANIGVSSTQLYDETNGLNTYSAESSSICVSANTGKMITVCFKTSPEDFTTKFYESVLGSGVSSRSIPTPRGNFPGQPLLSNGYFTLRCGAFNGPPVRTIWIKDV